MHLSCNNYNSKDIYFYFSITLKKNETCIKKVNSNTFRVITKRKNEKHQTNLFCVVGRFTSVFL